MLVFFVFAEIHFENLSAPLREPQCPASRAYKCTSRTSVPHFEIFSAPLREPISALREPQWPTSRAYKCTSRSSVPELIKKKRTVVKSVRFSCEFE